MTPKIERTNENSSSNISGKFGANINFDPENDEYIDQDELKEQNNEVMNELNGDVMTPEKKAYDNEMEYQSDKHLQVQKKKDNELSAKNVLKVSASLELDVISELYKSSNLSDI